MYIWFMSGNGTATGEMYVYSCVSHGTWRCHEKIFWEHFLRARTSRYVWANDFFYVAYTLCIFGCGNKWIVYIYVGYKPNQYAIKYLLKKTQNVTILVEILLQCTKLVWSNPIKNTEKCDRPIVIYNLPTGASSPKTHS